jgi:hypothetical protein
LSSVFWQRAAGVAGVKSRRLRLSRNRDQTKKPSPKTI